MTTTAGIKPAFIAAMNGATEREFGYRTWREFIEAAVESGHVHTERLATGHTGVLLPEETMETHGAAVDRASRRDTAGRRDGRKVIAAQARFRSDVWMTFVEWQDGHRRLWDCQASRAFMYPVDEQGGAAWDSDPGRFTPIEPIRPATQKEWMKEWVSTLPVEDQAALREALAPNAPLRAFRRELEARRLVLAWRSELQHRVAEHVYEWASANGIAWLDLIDHRTSELSAPIVTKPASRTSPSASRHRRPAITGQSTSTETERLRELVHRVVDQMSLAELAAIPIRAEHLLGHQ
ncbi:hypothetical protein [Nonomuraea insulae]|uniref:Uncharacterized protein n=1 Tax=Nonomuraea insulae TaxID=1616787 RepID=A0ABW1CSS6_9ACTN